MTEIFGLLTEFGAKSFHVDAEGNGAIGFVLEVENPWGGEPRRIPFRMEPRVEAIRRRLDEAKVTSRARHGAAGVAWAQLRHLLELQLEAVENGILSTEQAFAGFAVLSTGETIAEALSDPERLLLRSGPT